MEKRGADVVSVEVTEDPEWDFVPNPAFSMEEVSAPDQLSCAVCKIQIGLVMPLIVRERKYIMEMFTTCPLPSESSTLP